MIDNILYYNTFNNTVSFWLVMVFDMIIPNQIKSQSSYIWMSCFSFSFTFWLIYSTNIRVPTSCRMLCLEPYRYYDGVSRGMRQCICYRRLRINTQLNLVTPNSNCRLFAHSSVVLGKAWWGLLDSVWQTMDWGNMASTHIGFPLVACLLKWP